MFRPVPAAARLLAAATAGLALGGCAVDGPLSVLAPAGPGAAGIAAVAWAMIAGGLLLTALVTALGLHAALRTRSAPPRLSERALLVGGGLLLPIAVLSALIGWGVRAGHALLPRPPAAAMVELTARQWQWEARYPGAGRAPTAGRIDIPAGQPVDIHVRSADVIHSFWVPRLGGKIDAIPGRTNVVRLQADAPGIYHGVCAEYCGVGHARMAIEVHAHAAPGPP